jgi:hypothetical protein
MARMDIHYSFSVNGVAKLHTEILKHTELNNFYEIYPERFNNKTNGITFRRWLLYSNPRLTWYIETLIGGKFKKDAKNLKNLLSYIDDKAVLENVSYVLASDTMTFTDYTNNNEFDLCWFGRTASSYNYRATGEAVPVELSHALTWITVKVYGEGTPVANWNITSITLADVVASGTATCNGATKKAIWTPATTEATKTIYSGTRTITDAPAELTNNVIIPSLPLQLTVNYSFAVQGQTKTDSKTVSLKLNEGNTQAWESGVHYTYTLFFKGNEILVAPSYGEWTPKDQTVTVE